MNRLAEAFEEMMGVVRPRPDQDEAGIEAATRRLWRALNEYGEAVALKALDLWPRRSPWFPTEHELRELCAELSAEHAMAAASNAPVDTSRGRYLQPVGKTAALVERVRKVRGDAYVKSWLAGGISCLFTDDAVLTTGLGVERLCADFWDAMQEFGVKAQRSDAATQLLRDYCDKRDLTFEPKRGRGR